MDTSVHNTKLSVIVPAYNRAGYILDCVNSLKLCGVPGVEIIVVDDGSTDGTGEMVSRLEGVKYLRQVNSGVAASRNNGFRQSTGEYVAFLDSDDRWLPGVAAKMIALLDKYGEIGAVFADALSGNEKEGYESWMRKPGRDDFFALPHIMAEEKLRVLDALPFFRRLVTRNCVFIGSVIMRRDAFLKAGGFSLQRTGSDDWEICIRLSALVKMGYYDEPLAIYLRHPGSLSSGADFMANGFRISLENILAADLGLRQSEITFVRKKLKGAYFYYAYLAYERGDYRACRQRLADGMKKMGPGFTELAYFLKCLLPAGVISSMRRIKRAAGECVKERRLPWFMEKFIKKARYRFSANPNTREFWNRRLSGKEGGRWRDHVYLDILEDLPGDGNFSILDIGCALGDGCLLIKERFPRARVSGCDFSDSAIALAGKKSNTIEFFVLDIIRQELGKRYDYISLVSILEHFDEPLKVIDKCLAKVNRHLIISAPYQKDISYDVTDEHRFAFNEGSLSGYDHDHYIKQDRDDPKVKRIIYIVRGKKTGHQ